MNDAFGVGRGESAGDLLRIVNRVAKRQRASDQLIPELFAFEQLGHDIWRNFVRADVIDGQNVRVIEGGGGASFQLEAPQPVSIFGEFWRQNFDRHFAVKA